MSTWRFKHLPAPDSGKMLSPLAILSAWGAGKIDTKTAAEITNEIGWAQRNPEQFRLASEEYAREVAAEKAAAETPKPEQK